MQIKRDCGKELDLLAKDRDYYLKNIFFDRVHELEAQQHVLWDIIENNRDKPEIQIKAIHELRPLTIDLRNAYETLPATTTLEVPTSVIEEDAVLGVDPDEPDPEAVF